MKRDPISDLRRYARVLEDQVSSERSRAAATSALRSPAPEPSSRRRTVVALAATAVFGVSNVALASVANPAVPGDALYGIDRAYESIGSVLGIDDTNASERAVEVVTLQQRGESAAALELVIETLTRLLEADAPADAVRQFTAGLGNEEFTDTLDELLDVARGVETSGPVVSEIAKTIVDSVVLPEQARGNPGGPDDPGSQGDGNGPPTDPGNQGDGNGPPADPGNQGNGNGPPDNPGNGGDPGAGQNGGRP